MKSHSDGVSADGVSGLQPRDVPAEHERSHCPEALVSGPQSRDAELHPRAILFDLGNTLLEYTLYGRWRTFLQEQLAEVYRVIGDGDAPFDLTPDMFATYASDVIGGENSHQLMHGGRTWPLPDRMQKALDGLGITWSAEQMARAMDELYLPIHECNRPYPDTVEVLERLRAQGFPLAIVSDTPWDAPGNLTRGDMRQWGLVDYFGALLFSGDNPYRKPHPWVIRTAAARLGVKPEECVMVGDTLAADVAAANAAGIPSIWIDRGYGIEPWEGARPTVTVKALQQVLEAVTRG